ncbi:MAG: hypothetical protein VX796_05710 [Pseudomonadota bacterium]|nr:hypothetical protein [Pseudomonadota bacterium]
MQIKVLATGIAADHYEINGDVITAFVGEESDNYDLSGLEEGDVVTEVSPIGGIRPIRSATRENGVLKVTLCQRVGAGHWSESGWMDSSDYDPDAVHVVFDVSKIFSGIPWASTRLHPRTIPRSAIDEGGVGMAAQILAYGQDSADDAFMFEKDPSDTIEA